jgi:mannose-6-phosphate isomerase-like protein (cupin superfamily)
MEIDDEVEAPIVGTVTETVHENKRPKSHSHTHTSSTNDQPTVITQTSAQIPTIITGQSQMGNAELEMEDWEVAPGRMKDDSSNSKFTHFSSTHILTFVDIAFSNSYLTSNHPVTVSEDVSFNVTVLKPGHSSHWNVEDGKLRTCSVAAGKVRVTMGENTFHLGPNGMFVIRPGQACKVENRLYLDSVVHCTTIGDFSLQ